MTPVINFLSSQHHHTSIDYIKEALYDLHYIHSMSDLGIKF